LLEYDDVMNKQREIIYDMRLRILEGDWSGVEEEAREVLDATAEIKVTQHVEPEAIADDWDLPGLKEDLRRSFLLPFDWLDELVGAPSDGEGEELPRTYEELIERVRNDLFVALDRRIEEWELERAEAIVRQVMLRVIDEKWRDHLYELDQLKGGIQYRAWGQRDPLVEYKKEAFEMFVDMMDELNTGAAEFLFRVQMLQPGQLTAEERRRRERLSKEQVAVHQAAPAMASVAQGPSVSPPSGDTGTTTAGRGQAPARPDRQGVPSPAATFVREGDKVGRNDPCPCGSGKKFKKCHGS
jgi:preprotein translocase subunit SecA